MGQVFTTQLGGGSGSGSVTSVSVATAQGFAGTVANPTTTPAITISTTVTGLLQGNGTSVVAATLGTGVLTALGVNVGSAGAFVTYNGDAGTPSALVGTNITGTASGLTAGTVTTNANLTGDVTSSGNATTLATTQSAVHTWSAVQTISANGAASTPSLIFTGTLFTGGSGTATFPQIFVQPTGTAAVTSWSTSGTIFGANVVSGFAGAFLDFHAAGASSVFNVLSTGALNSAGAISGFSLTATSGSITAASGSLTIAPVGAVTFSTRGVLTSPAAGSVQFGSADVDTAPVAQTLRSQGALAGGTSNVAGANFTVIASPGKGTGAGGQFIFQTTPAGSTGTTVNAVATGLTITAPAINMQPSVVVGNQAIATNATDGFLYVATCAGTPTGTPTTFTGRVALVYDTTNDQFWIYNAAWKQPKTPAGAAVVNWQ